MHNAILLPHWQTIPCIKSAATLLLLLCLSACGGSSGPSMVIVTGTVSGFSNDGLSLSDGLNAITVPTNATTFSFPTHMNADLIFSVNILAQPVGLQCYVDQRFHTASLENNTPVNVTCGVENSLGGVVTGLTDGQVLTLANGTDTVKLTSASKNFSFPTKLFPGVRYGVSVKTQPDLRHCSVVNGSGTMGTDAIRNIEINCI